MNIILLTGIFTASFLSIYLLMQYAKRFGLLDIPNKRSMHTKLTPRGAGIAFVLSVLIVLLLFNFEHIKTYYYVYLSIATVFAVGTWDDLKSVSPTTKFIFIFVSVLLLYYHDIAIYSLGTYFGYEIPLPGWMVFPFTFLAIAGFTNALNLIDGLDGLAALVSIVILTTFFAIGLQYKDELLISLSSFFIATLLAFLIFNWNPAKIFMGDSGSLTLGIVISILSIQALQYNTPASILLIIAMPLLDTFIVMTRRIQRHLSPFKADKNHMHHFAFNVKGDVRFTVIMLTLTQVLFSIIGYQVREEDNLLSLVLVAILFYIFLNLFDQRLRRRRKEDENK